MRNRLGVWIAAWALAPAVGRAAVMERYDLARLVQAADVVVTGRVLATESYRVEGRILTRVTVQPVVQIKGDAGPTIAVEVAGGVVDGIGQRVSGAARFTAGEDVALFLARRPERRTFRVVGMAQGKLRIEARLSGPVVVRDLSGVHTVEAGLDGVLQAVEPALPVEQSLEAFIWSLAAQVAGAR